MSGKELRLQLYLIPLLLFIFLMNYHYYGFYEDDFKKIFNLVRPSIKAKQYETVQELHPYYPIYKLSKEVQDPEKNIIYIRTRTDKKNKLYLHELNIMVDYFFYPHRIRPYTMKELYKLRLVKGNIIIADYPLPEDRIARYNLAYLSFVKKNLVRINRRKEDDIFIYKVMK